MTRAAAKFAILFLALIGVFSVLLMLDAVDRLFVIPFTGIVARASSLALGLLGMPNEVRGTIIVGAEGFAVNILNGCNGVYVTAILVSAVLAFPSTLKEKLIGLAVGIPGIQVINLVRITSLYWLGLRHPQLFEQFHYYVWQTGVIVLSMAIWIFWAEVLVRGPAPARAAGGR